MENNTRSQLLVPLYKKRWTEGQIDLLIESLLSPMTVDELVQRTGRTEYAVRRAISYLKDATTLQLKPRMFQAGQLWTQAEEIRLRDVFVSGESLAELVGQVGRTSNAVLGRLQQMNLVVLVGDTYHRNGAKRTVSLGYTWSDHARLDIEAYGNPWLGDESEGCYRPAT